jgi:hypothetical protein
MLKKSHGDRKAFFGSSGRISNNEEHSELARDLHSGWQYTIPVVVRIELL